jgi:phenylalanine-4-hydroxylase
MFADQDFADFSQEIGLASLGASDEDVKRLATCYWHSVEFGLMRDRSTKGLKEGRVKAYGAGLLSSFGELEYSCANSHFFPNPSDKHTNSPPPPKLLPWDPKVACVTEYPICEYQPTYFVAESLQDAKLKMREFCESLPKPFYARYNNLTSSIWVDRAVRGNQNDLKTVEKVTYDFK